MLPRVSVWQQAGYICVVFFFANNLDECISVKELG